MQLEQRLGVELDGLPPVGLVKPVKYYDVRRNVLQSRIEEDPSGNQIRGWP